MQSRTDSLREAILNILIGYMVAILSQLAIFPLFGVHLPLSDNLLIGLYFTVISLIRSYTLRRIFNKKAKHGTGVCNNGSVDIQYLGYTLAYRGT